MKQDTTQTTPFELVYSRTATLLIEIKINTYSTEPIIEDNFQKTLLRKTYDLMKMLENKQQKAADNIQKSQEKQKKRHNNQLSEKPVEFKIEDKVLLHYTKDNKILTKAAHSDRLKSYYHIVSSSTSNISQLGVQRILVQPDEISQDLEPIIIIGPNT
ncbi:hypothetical protein G9A89_002753 [Geosiphon pyriformis]|nr:hypothetical protein G9A89_002753 [Geosiphon pyriformis]